MALRGPWPGCRRAASFPSVCSLSARGPRCFAAGLHSDGLFQGRGLRPGRRTSSVRAAVRWRCNASNGSWHGQMAVRFPSLLAQRVPRAGDSAPSASLTHAFPGRSPYHQKSSAGRGPDRTTTSQRAALPDRLTVSRGWGMRGSSWGEAPLPGGRRLSGWTAQPSLLGSAGGPVRVRPRAEPGHPEGTKASGPQGCSSARDAAHWEVQAGSEKMRAPIPHKPHVGGA